MSLGADLQLRLRKKFQPSSTVYLNFRGVDLAVLTDRDGNAMTAFIGKLTDEGKIRGQRYARTLNAAPDGSIIKDHWDLKGKV
jgi:hypothetical protein